MPTDSMRRFSGAITACCLFFGLSRMAVAAPCPIRPDSFLDTHRFQQAFEHQKSSEDLQLRELADTKKQPGPVLACWKLAELQAHQGLDPKSSDHSALSTTPPQKNNSCGWPAGRWERAAYWLTQADLDGEQDDCAGLRRSLLTQCLELVISEPVACTVVAGGERPLDRTLTNLLEAFCRVDEAVVPACPTLLEMLKVKPPIETPQARRMRLALAGGAFGVGAVALVLGITQMLIPLGTSGSCPQNGIDYPCGPDRYGLGIPLAVGGGLLVAAGGALLAVKF